jgi:hypothetical protein
MEEEQIFTKLFGTISIIDENHLDTLLLTMDKNNATILLIHAVKLAYESQLFSLGESEVISRAIRVLNRIDNPIDEKKDDE